MTWRKKSMALGEWAPFQDRFAEMFTANGGNPNVALFVKGAPGAEQQELFASPVAADMAEHLSPGGWSDSEPPSPPDLSLLVGVSDAWDRHGIAGAPR